MNNFKIVLTLLFINSLAFFFHKVSQAQEASILRSTLSNCGSNPQTSYHGKTYNIIHSIGQQGITGTFTKNNKTLIQGYIHPELKEQKPIVDFELLDVIVKPIPYTDQYTITLNNEQATSINLSVYNTLGQKKYSQSYQQPQDISIDLSSYSSGCYILYIHTNQSQFSTKLIKK